MSELLDRTHPNDRRVVDRAIGTLVRYSAPVSVQVRMHLPKGHFRNLTLRMRYVSGTIFVQVTDIVPEHPASGERRESFDTIANAQHRSEARLSLASYATRDIVWDWDVDADTYYFSPRLAEALGFPRPIPRLDGPGFVALMHPDDIAAEAEARSHHIREHSRYDIDYRLRDTAGKYRWFRAVGECLRNEEGEALYMAGTITDVDALKFAESQMIEQRDQLESLTRQLQDMSVRLINSQEDERRHIARELHDQTGQTLTAAVLNLEFWLGKGVAAEEISHALDEVKRALTEIRDISRQLRPPMLDEAGLETALRSYLDRQASAGKFEVSLLTEGHSRRLAREVEITAFRLVQEAITNIIRHAGARHVDVSLKISTSDLVIRISDDGSGCVANDAMSNAASGTSLGLISMNERAALVGGRCEFISTPGIGAMVLARIPLSQ